MRITGISEGCTEPQFLFLFGAHTSDGRPSENLFPLESESAKILNIINLPFPLSLVLVSCI